MPHFGIPLLGHGTVGGFLDSGQTDIGVTGLTGTRTVTGTAITQATASESFVRARAVLDNILSGGILPATFRETQVELQSKNFTDTINELITVREQDIAKINENFRNFAIGSDVVNEQIKEKLSPTSLTDSLKFGLSNLQTAIGGTGLVIGILIVGVILLKK